MGDERSCLGEDTFRELFREDQNDMSDPDNFYAPSVHVTNNNQIAMNVGGRVIIRSIKEWHYAIAKTITEEPTDD